MTSILIVNDDGISSPGLEALASALSKGFDVTIVAPRGQTSWIGKASSYNQELRMEESDVAGLRAYALSGTPSDCACAGIYHLCRKPPALVISGINIGANVGDSYIYSSGTVGGALEAVLAGVPALAVGVDFSHDITLEMEFGGEGNPGLFRPAALLTRRLVRVLLAYPGEVPRAVFNVNLPENPGAEKKVKITHPARYSYGSFLRKEGGGFRHTGAAKDYSRVEEGTDMAAIREGHPSLSILNFLDSSGVTEEFLRYLHRGMNEQTGTEE